MCIALISTAHPSYSLIVIDNRDEFLHRPTSSVDWWPEPSSHVLGSRDLARAAHGTWMGVTKQGRIAVLTNYREDTTCQAIGVCSRGAIVSSWLAMPPDRECSTRQFIEEMISGGTAQSVGGFSLVCGKVNEPLAIMSNRVSHVDRITWVAKDRGETVGLSNTAFGDRSWPKIIQGETLMKKAIEAHVQAGEGEDELIQRLLDVLSTDTLPRLADGAGLETYINHLRNSVFIPVIGGQDKVDRAADEIAGGQAKDKVEVLANGHGSSDPASYCRGLYGTQKQTVVLVDHKGRIKYFERTLFDNAAERIPIGEGDRCFEFMIEQ
ncbi:hypothetical protein VTN00DRAFT_363 [Thermoascus crustaceus]|uniref:uncharacterized protein n=1 Tax=Thermoascus crustaceus TaxID=5088 RepID=UPI003742F0C0